MTNEALSTKHQSSRGADRCHSGLGFGISFVICHSSFVIRFGASLEFEVWSFSSMPGHFCYPRPEYPRPDRQRGMVEGYDWLNLNGPWQFRFDGERKGVDEKWFAPEAGEWREQIIVPFC